VDSAFSQKNQQNKLCFGIFSVKSIKKKKFSHFIIDFTVVLDYNRVDVF